MIRAGIFSIIETVVKISGNAIYVFFAIAGIIALLNAYSYSKLGLEKNIFNWLEIYYELIPKLKIASINLELAVITRTSGHENNSKNLPI